MPYPYGAYSAPAVYAPPVSPQQQLAQMQQQMYPSYLQQPAQPVQVQQQGQSLPVKGWAVASEDEARKAMIDLDGSVFVFPDFTNGCIHTKQISTVDFSPVFKTYRLVEASPAPQSAPEKPSVDLSGFVPREDFNRLSETVQGLSETVSQLSAPAKRTTAKEETK